MESIKEPINFEQFIEHSPAIVQNEIERTESKIYELSIAILDSITEYSSLNPEKDRYGEVICYLPSLVISALLKKSLNFTPLNMKLLIFGSSFLTSFIANKLYDTMTNRLPSPDRQRYINILFLQVNALRALKIYSVTRLSENMKNPNYIEPGIIIRAILSDIYKLATQPSNITMVIGQDYSNEGVSVPGLRHYITGRSKLADILVKNILSNPLFFPENCPPPLYDQLASLTHYDKNTKCFNPRVELIEEDECDISAAKALSEQGIFRQKCERSSSSTALQLMYDI